MFWIVLLFAQAATSPTQIERGEALFTQSCASCHALKGKGNAVGPDLMGVGKLGPAAIAMSARSTVTQYVQVVKLKSGATFPAMPGKANDKTVELFDLSKNPPEKQVVAPADIDKQTGNDQWQHPPAAGKIEASKLADIVAYIRFAASNSRKTVEPDEVK